MLPKFARLIAGSCLVISLLSACSGSASVVKTLDDPGDAERRFGNVLVIGIAADYDGRAMFERAVVSRLRADGASATAYYTVVGRNPPIDRSTVVNAVRSRNFDGVLVTRVKEREVDVSKRPGSSTMTATTMGGRGINLFRYDYQELNEPDRIDLSVAVTLLTELYDAAEERPIWAIETTSRDKANVGELVDTAADAIVRQLRRDRLIDN